MLLNSSKQARKEGVQRLEMNSVQLNLICLFSGLGDGGWIRLEASRHIELTLAKASWPPFPLADSKLILISLKLQPSFSSAFTHQSFISPTNYSREVGTLERVKSPRVVVDIFDCSFLVAVPCETRQSLSLSFSGIYLFSKLVSSAIRPTPQCQLAAMR